MEMRKVLCNEIAKLMEKDEDIIFMDADLATANGTLSLREKFPERAFDVGISEQNMAGMAAGMSAYGMKPFICTFTPFATRRICDQVAISMCYAKQNVKIIGTDAGTSSQLNGGTHMSFEDIGVLRSIPGIVIIDVTDEYQLKEVINKVVNYEGVVYIRVIRKQAREVFNKDYEMNIFKGELLKKGDDISIFATGNMTYDALKAAEVLEEKGIEAEVINIHTLKPIDKEIILESVRKTGVAITCEDHNIIGGLYSALCEVVCSDYPVKVKAIGVKDHFGEVGTFDFLREKYHMTPKDIVELAVELISNK